MTFAYNLTPADPILATLPDALVTALDLSPQRLATIDRGRSIIASSQPLDAVYLISEGWAVSKLSIETGDTQILDILGAGSLAGITRLSDDAQDDYAAIALQSLKAYRIDINRLKTVCAQDEALARWLSQTLSRQSQRMQRHITALGQLPARGRLAFAMLRILEVARQAGGDVINETIRLPMTQEEIGNMLGLTNVSISKLMSAFRKDGLIDYGRNRIIIRDVEALSEICGMSLEEPSPARG